MEIARLRHRLPAAELFVYVRHRPRPARQHGASGAHVRHVRGDGAVRLVEPPEHRAL